MLFRSVGLRLPTLFRGMSSLNAEGKLNGKVAIVTASTDGIGLAIARRLAFDGAKVVISSLKEKNVEKALQGIYAEGIPKDRLVGLVCHVGNKEDRTKLIEKAVKEFGGIDFLVSNAAINPVMGPALDCPESAWDKIFEVNVKAPFLLTQEILPHLQKRKEGSIVFISSIAGFQPFQVLGPYSVSKTALLGLTKVLAQQLGPDNIRVNCIAPGIIKTRFSQALTQSPEIVDKMLEQVPLGRLGEPDEIGGIVSFLCSKDASYITGENFVVAGGQASRL
jgi:dehydrogenase/reductase SDR family protein 4